MNYQITIIGMHCNGCKNLITLSLEELGYTNINVDLEKQTATFTTQKEKDDVKTDLEKIFIEDLTNYEFKDLEVIK